MSKRKLWTLVKLFIGLSVLILLFKSVGWKDFFEVLKDINLFYIIPLLAISFLMITISCLKWQMLLAIRKINVTIYRLVSLYLIGYFFSNFMPGQHGGDAVRAYIFGRHIKNQVESFAAVFMERFTGLSALIGMVFFVSVINFQLIKDTGLLFLFILVIAGYLIFLLLLFSQKMSKKIQKMRVPHYMENIREKIKKLHSVIMSFKGYKSTVAKTLIISLLFHTMTIVNTLVVCLSLDINVRILDIALIVPFVLLVSSIPISINSIGIQEGAFVYFFSLVGVSFPAALSIALVLRAKNLVFALIGGVIFAAGHKAARGPQPNRASALENQRKNFSKK